MVGGLLTAICIVLAVVCVYYAIIAFIQRRILAGVGLLVLACLIGPGGFSLIA